MTEELISQFGEATQRLAVTRNPHSYRLEEIKEILLKSRSWNYPKEVGIVINFFFSPNSSWSHRENIALGNVPETGR